VTAARVIARDVAGTQPPELRALIAEAAPEATAQRRRSTPAAAEVSLTESGSGSGSGSNAGQLGIGGPS
jgi:hypothetical protein